MNGRCIDCHWSEAPPDDDLMCPPAFLSCACPEYLFGTTPKQYAALTESSVLAENGDGWGMYVGPKFGCVHWMLPVIEGDLK